MTTQTLSKLIPLIIALCSVACAGRVDPQNQKDSGYDVVHPSDVAPLEGYHSLTVHSPEPVEVLVGYRLESGEELPSTRVLEDVNSANVQVSWTFSKGVFYLRVTGKGPFIVHPVPSEEHMVSITTRNYGDLSNPVELSVR